jgi:hypothetical protein
MKAAKLTLTALLLCLAALSSATAFEYISYDGRDAMQAAGPGGEKKIVDGIDFWMSGTPTKPYQILGSITDERPTNMGIFGLIFNLNRSVINQVKKVGGDAVVLAVSQDKVVGVTGGGYYSGQTCQYGYCSGGYVDGSSSINTNRLTKYWVVKYIDMAPGAGFSSGNGAVGSAAPVGDKGAITGALDAASKASSACNAQVEAMPEYAPLISRYLVLGGRRSSN